ncbi:MAG: motility protein A [Kiloniellaceae bacterium]
MASLSATRKASPGIRGPVGSARGPTVDVATLLGVAGAFAVIAAAMTLGGSPGSFVNVPAILIVVVGTFLVTTVSFTLDEVVRAQSVMLRSAVYHAEAPEDAARRMIYLADVARQHGVLRLQSTIKDLYHSRFLAQAVGLVVDGLPTEEIKRILDREIHATRERHMRSAGFLRRAGEVAPAMGLIGTLVGLVQMLGNLEDPSSIGPSMAVALLTTFYGAVLATMVFNPLASKLERISEVEWMVNQIYTIGAASISRQENPGRLEMMINTMLSPAQRVRYFG